MDTLTLLIWFAEFVRFALLILLSLLLEGNWGGQIFIIDKCYLLIIQYPYTFSLLSMTNNPFPVPSKKLHFIKRNHWGQIFILDKSKLLSTLKANDCFFLLLWIEVDWGQVSFWLFYHSLGMNFLSFIILKGYDYQIFIVDKSSLFRGQSLT